ncbi:MAG TPA: arsenate reductase ArsC [Vicinamibacteria bacterium]
MRHSRSSHAVLFLCRDNAILGPMAEALLNHWGRGRFTASSAGWEPAPGVHAVAVRVLRRAQLLPVVLKPRSLSEVAGPDAPAFGVVVLLGQEFPGGTVPLKGDPALASWHISDPAAIAGPMEAQDRAFERAFREIEARVKIFASLSLEGVDRLAAERRLAEMEATAATS